MSSPSSTDIRDRAGTGTAADGIDRLRSIFGHDGPFVSVYLASLPFLRDSADDLRDRWSAMRSDLEVRCAPQAALDAIEARLGLPAPEDVAAVGILAAADGGTVVEYGLEPPREDVAYIDNLPYVAPLLEWHQRRVPHLVVTANSKGADIAIFGRDHESSLEEHDGSPADVADVVVQRVDTIGAELVIVAGDRSITPALADTVASAVPVGCRVVADTNSRNVDDLADNAVRQVSDTAARKTVGLLQEMRFLAAHGDAVDGVSASVAALCAGDADVVLIHDDPTDGRRAWFGPEAGELSLEPVDGRPDGRLVDAVIREAVLCGADVHIIPSTGPQGPDDDTAVLSRSGPSAE